MSNKMLCNEIWMDHIINEDIHSLSKWLEEHKRIDYASRLTGFSLLTWACYNKKESVIRYLLQNGANPFYEDYRKQMAWIMCIKMNLANVRHWEQLYNISQFMSNPLTQIKINYFIPQLIRNNRFEEIRFIFKNISVNLFKGVLRFYNNNRHTFIPYSILAIELDSKEFLNILINFGYDINEKSIQNNTINIYDYCRFTHNYKWLNTLLKLKDVPEEQIKIEKEILSAYEKLIK